MITNTGKSIIAKYMLGQAPAYASYIALGCGIKPFQTNDTVPDYSNNKNLKFEMFRIPISSRGYVVEDNVSKIVFTGELPTEERYEISEVGIYSAGADPTAVGNDSRSVLLFSNTEGWTNEDNSDILTILEPLDAALSDDVIATTSSTFKTNSDNRIFYNTTRASRYERCRYFNNLIALKSNSSSIDTSGSHFSIASGAHYIKANGITVDFSKNSPSDELRLAFSVVNKNGGANIHPSKVAIMIEFVDSNSVDYSRFEAVIEHGTTTDKQDFINNRYCVLSKQLQQLNTTNGFTWNSVNQINIYACAYESSSVSSNFYIMLDALRLENTTSNNPLYGLTGYSVVKNDDSSTIIKNANTNNYVEFRFGIGIG